MKWLKNKAWLTVFATLVTILFAALLVLNIKTSINDDDVIMILLFSSLLVVSLFIYGLALVFFWKGRYSKVIELVNSINSIDSTQEEIFEVGTIMYDESLNITFITPYLLTEGFDGYIGKKVTSLDLNLETSNKQEFVWGSHKWEVVVSRKNRTLFLKDITIIDTLTRVIDSQLKGVISIHTAFSKKINFNDSVKADATLNINQTIKEWVLKNGGLLNASLSTEGTVTAVFNWRKGEKDIASQSILESIKKSTEKIKKDVTISIGVAYGDSDYSELFDMSLKSLELSKNRGGDQIILHKPDGEFEYVGFSKQQAVSDSALTIKRFYSEFITDLTRAKEIFISSHSHADLDAIGSVMGIKALAELLNIKAYIVLPDLDEASKTLFDSLKKEKRDWFIDLDEAKKEVSSRTHFVITDTSNVENSQVGKLLSDFDASNITVIDHHRVSKGSIELDETRTLIQTSTSSASELVVDMLKIHLGIDAQNELDKNVSTALLAGIKLDSKQLTKNVTNNTFETVSFLINNDADVNQTNLLFRPSMSLIKLESEAFGNIKKQSNGVIFTYIGEEKTIKDEETSIIADKLLVYEGVEATFVLAKVAGNKYKLSARSNGKINVQKIAEALGGGGHFNVAASVWPASKKSFNAVIKEINSELGKIK